MARLSTLKNRRVIRDVAIDFGEGEVLNVKVNMNALSYGRQAEIQKAIQDGDGEAVGRYFLEQVDDWDLQDDDGQVLPRTIETINDLGMETVSMIFTRVAEAVNPKSASSRN